jgi:hypothetical protein
MRTNDYDITNVLTLDQLQRFVGTDYWVYGYITDRFRTADYYINIVDFKSVYSDEINMVVCYKIDTFWIDLLLDHVMLEDTEIRNILEVLRHDSWEREEIELDSIRIPKPVDVLTTNELLEIVQG